MKKSRATALASDIHFTYIGLVGAPCGAQVLEPTPGIHFS